MPELAYVNGTFMPLEEARVSVEDRGFLFADAVYEVLIAYDGRPFKMAEHLKRLEQSAGAIRLKLPLTLSELEAMILEGIRKSNFQETKIYLQVTRGVAPRAHSFPADAQPTLVAVFRPRPEFPAELRRQGVAVITTEDTRWAKCYIKSVALLPNVLANQQAAEAGAFEAIFVSRDGTVREGTASNVFRVAGNRVFTPPKSEQILHGITREVVIECSRNAGFELIESDFEIEELMQADEVFLTGTTVEVLGVREIDRRPVGNESVGPVTKAIYEEYQRQKRAV